MLLEITFLDNFLLTHATFRHFWWLIRRMISVGRSTDSSQRPVKGKNEHAVLHAQDTDSSRYHIFTITFHEPQLTHS